MITISEISRRLASQAAAVTRYLLPNGKPAGREWLVGSISGEAGESLKVCIEGAKCGVWSDFASGEAGDLVDLWVAVRGTTMVEALKEIKGYLSIEETAFAGRDRKKVFSRPAKLKGAKAIESNSPVMQYLKKKRMLTEDTIKAYNVGECDKIGPWKGWKREKPWDGPWMIFPYRKDDTLLSVKYLHLELNKSGKKQTLVEANCQPSLFGWKVIKSNDRVVTICEGEIDAMSLFQYGHPALSVPFGGGKGDKQQWIEYEWENLQQFETVHVCMDNDEEGEVATNELINRLGRHRCKVVKLPLKDANECLKQGISKEEIDRCFVEAKSLDPVELKRASRFKEQTKERFYPPDGKVLGVEGPFQKLKNKLRFRAGELSVWVGINGHGKSQMLGQFTMHFAHQGQKICIASLEMKPEATLERIVRQLADCRLPDLGRLDQAFDWLHGKFWIFDVVGVVEADKVLEVFKYAYHRYGIDQFVIDSFMRCGIDEEDKKAQLDFMNKLVAFVNQYGVHIHLVAHPRKGLNEDHYVGKMDVKGSGCITDLAWNVFSIWRNKEKEKALSGEGVGNASRRKGTDDPRDQPDGVFICDKQREGEWENMLGIYFDHDSLRYYDSDNYRAPKYLEDSSIEENISKTSDKIMEPATQTMMELLDEQVADADEWNG
jgi:twinkle protein